MIYYITEEIDPRCCCCCYYYISLLLMIVNNSPSFFNATVFYVFCKSGTPALPITIIITVYARIDPRYLGILLGTLA